MLLPLRFDLISHLVYIVHVLLCARTFSNPLNKHQGHSLFVCPTGHLTVHLFIHLSIRLSVFLSVRLSVCLFVLHLCLHPSVHLSIYPPIYWSIRRGREESLLSLLLSYFWYMRWVLTDGVVLQEARRLNIHRTVHAGEAAPAASVKEVRIEHLISPNIWTHF